MSTQTLTLSLSLSLHIQTIFKTGDDLRQDQLVIQIITLMDKLLRKENLDLKLTPYKVLATGPDHGLVQFIASTPLANVLTEHSGNLLAYLRQHHPDENSPGTYGVDPGVMDTYIKSCGVFPFFFYFSFSFFSIAMRLLTCR